MEVPLNFNYSEPHRHIAELKLQHQANSKEAERRKRHDRKKKTRGHQQNNNSNSPYCPHYNNGRFHRNGSSSAVEHQALMQNNPSSTLSPYPQYEQSLYALPQQYPDANILPSDQQFWSSMSLRQPDYFYLLPKTPQQVPLPHYGLSTAQPTPRPLKFSESQVNRHLSSFANPQGYEPEPPIQNNQEPTMTPFTHPIDGCYPAPSGYNSPLVPNSHWITDSYGQMAQSMNSPAAYHDLATSLPVTSSPMPMSISGNPDRQAGVMSYQYAEPNYYMGQNYVFNLDGANFSTNHAPGYGNNFTF